MADEYAEVTVTFVTTTERAVLVKDADGDPHWIPRVHVQFDGDLDDVDRDTTITLEVKEWAAKDRGLI